MVVCNDIEAVKDMTNRERIHISNVNPFDLVQVNTSDESIVLRNTIGTWTVYLYYPKLDKIRIYDYDFFETCLLLKRAK